MRCIGFCCFTVLLLIAPAFAGPHAGGFIAHPFNGSTPPITSDGVTTLQIKPGECDPTNYPDGRGESDCSNGNVRSNIWTESSPESVGQSYEYALDLRLDPAFVYEGFQNEELEGVYLANEWDSALHLLSWEGNLLHNFVYHLKADRRRGITFLDETCQSVEEIGDWLHFSLRVKWTNDDRGWVEARCNDRIIYLAENVVSTAAPHCYPRNQCEPGKTKKPKAIVFVVGPAMDGYGHTWKSQGRDSQFVAFQADGITMQVRNLSVTPGPELYGPEEKAQVVVLQEALNALGCDVGSADGVAGRKTREAALTCRDFPGEGLPRAFNVATLPVFVERYTSERAAALPPGGHRSPLLDVQASQVLFETTADGSFLATFIADVEGVGMADPSLRFMIIGGYRAEENRFEPFNIQLLESAKSGRQKIEACPSQWTEDRGDEGFQVVLQFERSTPNSYVAPGRDCIVSALPSPRADQLAFLADHFEDVARAVVENGLDYVTPGGLGSFLSDVANGKVGFGE